LSFRPWVSADGRTVAFDSNAVLAPGAVRGVRNVYIYDRPSRRTRLVSATVALPLSELWPASDPGRTVVRRERRLFAGLSPDRHARRNQELTGRTPGQTP
jgi:hypothetical protein